MLSLHSPYNGPTRVSVGNGQNLDKENTRKGFISTPKHQFNINNVLHVPSLSKNLLFVQKYASDNHCSLRFLIQDKATNRVLCQGPCKNGLYPILVAETSKISQLVAFSVQQNVLSVWLNQLGHHGPQPFSFILNSLCLQTSSNFVCNKCLIAKTHRHSLPLSDKISNSPLDLLHLDIWGPSSTGSCLGFQFYLLIVDDFSRFFWVYLLKQKSEVPTIFIHFKNHMENLFSKTIKKLRSDGGGEFTSHKFKAILANSGIIHQVSCPYMPSQNGVAERKHRNLIETIIALLQTTSLPAKYWADVVLTTTFLINRFPSLVL